MVTMWYTYTRLTIHHCDVTPTNVTEQLIPFWSGPGMPLTAREESEFKLTILDCQVGFIIATFTGKVGQHQVNRV